MIDNFYPIPSNDGAQANEPSSYTTINQPPPYYMQGTENVPSYTSQNRSTGSGLYFANRGPITQQIQPNSKSSKYTLILTWSVFNTFCCIWPLGIIALIISVITLRTQGDSNEQKVRCGIISAVMINTLSTIGGIIVIIAVLVVYTG